MKCSFCDRFFSQFKCWAKSRGECDCPKCHGYCECEQNMLQKPEALQLADWLEYGNYNHEDVIKAVIELRRLHEAHDWQYKMAGDRLRRIEKLEAVNQELLNALQMVQQCLGGSDDPMLFTRTCKVVEAAIAKAENNK